MDTLRRYYKVLGVEPGAPLAEVRRAYRDLALVWHPDRFSSNPRLRTKAQEQFKQINAAYTALKASSAHRRSSLRQHQQHSTWVKRPPRSNRCRPRPSPASASCSASRSHQSHRASDASPPEPPSAYDAERDRRFNVLIVLFLLCVWALGLLEFSSLPVLILWVMAWPAVVGGLVVLFGKRPRGSNPLRLFQS